MSEPAPIEDIIANDRYWLGRAREMLTASTTGRDEASGRLCTALAWFWTVYTTVALVGVSLSNRDLPPWLGVLIGAPVVVLVIAYLLATWAMLPIDIVFDPRSPDEVKQAHILSVERKSARLRLASIATTLGALTVAAAAVVVAVLPSQSTTRFNATVDTNGPTVVIEGQFVGGQNVLIRIQERSTPGVNQPIPARSATLLVATNSGALRGHHEPLERGKEYDVVAEWTESTGRKTWTIGVKT